MIILSPIDDDTELVDGLGHGEIKGGKQDSDKMPREGLEEL
ncbi:hypothetical protein [Desulfonatronovibrio magnus]|nr:hypothetical protein [Desulfonatronovibrio magnus]